jgi:hypothetical protein
MAEVESLAGAKPEEEIMGLPMLGARLRHVTSQHPAAKAANNIPNPHQGRCASLAN